MPVHRFRLEIPADSLTPTLRLLARLQANPRLPTLNGSTLTLHGDIPATGMRLLQQGLASATRGEGIAEFAFARYESVTGVSPIRPRSDANPLNREEYLLQLSGRLGAQVRPSSSREMPAQHA
jgi:ribosomal protection tetracycline resistance protein